MDIISVLVILWGLISLLCGVDLYKKIANYDYLVPTLDERFFWPYLSLYIVLTALIGVGVAFWAAILWVAAAGLQYGVSYYVYRWKGVQWSFWATAFYHVLQVAVTLLLLLL